jgi:hypothetical protein
MRVPRRQAGNALLVAALLLAGVATALSFFVTSPRRSAGAGTVGRTPSASHNAAGPGSPGGLIIGLPGTGTGANGQATAGVAVPPTVTLDGAAALPSAHVHAGYTTPEDAVDGFYLALLSGSPTRACAYVTTPCPSFGFRPITGRVAMIGAVSHGGEALVEVTGTICVATSCRPLTDRVLMPAGPASFNASWTSLTSGVYGWAASPLPCVQDAGTRQWRVKLA